MEEKLKSGEAAGAENAPSAGPVVTECDFSRWAGFSAERVKQLSALHQAFATSLGNSLGAYLRVGIEAKLLGVEQVSYREFTERLPEQAYVVHLSTLPAAESAAIQIDIGILLPLIDLLLGGSGNGAIEARELTEIEEQIVETLLALICRELQLAWQAIVPVQFQVQRRLKQNQIPKLIAPEDKTLYLNFELVLNEIRGLVTIVFSSAITSRLLRLLGQDAPMPERGGRRARDERLRERLLDSRLTGELSIPKLALRVRELVDLSPGVILTLPHALSAPLSFSINGQLLWAGAPVSCGALRGAVLQRMGSAENFAGDENS